MVRWKVETGRALRAFWPGSLVYLAKLQASERPCLKQKGLCYLRNNWGFLYLYMHIHMCASTKLHIFLYHPTSTHTHRHTYIHTLKYTHTLSVSSHTELLQSFLNQLPFMKYAFGPNFLNWAWPCSQVRGIEVTIWSWIWVMFPGTGGFQTSIHFNIHGWTIYKQNILILFPQ